VPLASDVPTRTDLPLESSLTVSVLNDRAAALVADGSVWLGPVDVLIDHVAQHRLSVSGFALKDMWRRAARRGIELDDPADDVALMAFLLDASSGEYSLASVAQRYLGYEMTPPQGTLFDGEDETATLVTHVMVTSCLLGPLREQIVQWELESVYRTIELPLLGVLARMESRGIWVDRDLLSSIADEFAAEVASLDAEIQEMAGHPFKVGSPQQLQTVLFDELALPPTKKIKSGYSTDAASLEAIAALRLNRRAHLALSRTRQAAGYLRCASDCHDRAGLSNSRHLPPNGGSNGTIELKIGRTRHNIPVRSSEGRRLRYAFGPTPGWKLLVADYNQIELRVIAHLSQDPGLLSAFAEAADVHRRIAAIVFQCDEGDVTHDQREVAKAVSYGLAYGMEAFGLSQRLAIAVGEAKDIIDQYFRGFPSLRAYMDETVARVRQLGFSRTELGRIRPFPDLATASGPQRAAAERQAMNAGIQGLAADIFKVALVRVDRELAASESEARLVLQVHDEVVVECPPSDCDQVETIVRTSLETAVTLSVPLDVSLHWGDNWAEAKG
jgi:DNA polymerase-1